MINYDKAIEYINISAQRGSHPGLERILQLLKLMGNPQEEVRCIHVAGTNGKGSVSVMLASVLSAAGYTTGMFTSPYIYRINESFRINGVNISDDEFAEVISFVSSFAEQMRDKPTEFEVMTATAFEYFKRKHCDAAVIECGMGGKYDATNVITNPLLSIITNVAADHLSWLGNSVEEIACHKAGIIKARRPVIFGGTDFKAEKVIAEKAADMHSPFIEVHYNLLENVRNTSDGIVLSYGRFKNVKLSLFGAYQPRNAALVLASVELLREMLLEISDDAVYNGMKNALWQGRFETISLEPTVIYDGAHNPDGIKYAVESIRQRFGDKRVNVLIGVMADKDYETMVKLLCPVVCRVYTVMPRNPRALDSFELADVFVRNERNATAYEKLSEGLCTAYKDSVDNNRPLIALGSLYMYREVKDCLCKLKGKNKIGI